MEKGVQHYKIVWVAEKYWSPDLKFWEIYKMHVKLMALFLTYKILVL